jgi:hydrogenase maturation protease
MSATSVSGALVIGIGNTLAGDDGVGAAVARRLRRRRRSRDVRVLVVHQLTPELVEEIAAAERVIFVDAGLTGTGVEVTQVTPAARWSALAHTMTPAELLGLTMAICGSNPEALVVTVPGLTFEPGPSPSPRGRRHFQEAIRAVEAFL